jgi:2-polyprenyl-3-methyl-5-hydroxy-6-metoxy-1,4-benzoquinol methylase
MTGASGIGLRLLVAIASYGKAGDKYLPRLIEEYRSMRFDSHIVVLSNVKKIVPDGVEICIGLPTRNPWSLPWAHKKLFSERVNSYDLFIYSEDDILITQNNIEAFLDVSEVLPEMEIPGFLLYESARNGARNYVNLHGHFHWNPSSVCNSGPYTFAFLTNEHSACYLLTRKQLQRAIDSGYYLRPPRTGKYDLACTASTDPYTVCGFRKLICISHLGNFLVHHLPDKYTGPEFEPLEQNFDAQLRALMRIGTMEDKPSSLVETETRLPGARYSKGRDEPEREELLGLFPRAGGRVLSVGTGWGKAERWLEQKGLQVTAVPLDSVVGACLEGGRITVVYGDLFTACERLEGQNFDCLFFSNILHLVPKPEELLRRYARLLRPGGSILLVTPNIATAKNKLWASLRKPGYRELRLFGEGGVQFVSIRRVRSWFATAGLSIKSVKWAATRRFESIVRLSPELFGPMFGSEIIVLGKTQDAESTGEAELAKEVALPA